MKKVIFASFLSLSLILNPMAYSDATTADKAKIQQQREAYKAALKKYQEALKSYREAQMKARVDIKIAREIYKETRKKALSSEERLEALKTFQTAKATAFALVPKRPVRPTKPAL